VSWDGARIKLRRLSAARAIPDPGGSGQSDGSGDGISLYASQWASPDDGQPLSADSTWPGQHHVGADG
jgi:hypothetical protein